MSERYRDFDEATAALEPVRFKVKEREYEVAADPPADAVLRLMEDRSFFDTGEQVRLFKRIIGEEQFQQMRDDGVGWKQFNELVDWLAEIFGLQTGAKGEQALEMLRAQVGGNSKQPSPSPASSTAGEQ
jgi:hypothetical protein